MKHLILKWNVSGGGGRLTLFLWVQTDTASVLHEAMGYIRFLQEQVQVLCSPYLKTHPSSLSHFHHQVSSTLLSHFAQINFQMHISSSVFHRKYIAKGRAVTVSIAWNRYWMQLQEQFWQVMLWKSLIFGNAAYFPFDCTIARSWNPLIWPKRESITGPSMWRPE